MDPPNRIPVEVEPWIVALDRGRIVEQGRHVELAAHRGAYARLVAAQLPAAPVRVDHGRAPGPYRWPTARGGAACIWTIVANANLST
jgi:hypothetical protein